MALGSSLVQITVIPGPDATEDDVRRTTVGVLTLIAEQAGRDYLCGALVVAAVVLAAGVTGGVAGSVGSVPADRAEKPIAGTSCSEFPADNWWHADVSDLPVHPRSRQWLSHMSTDSDLHPDFGPSYGDGPNYGIPITVVGSEHRKVRVPLRVRLRERPGALPARQGHPDRGRAPLGRRPARDHRRQAAGAGSTRPSRPGSATAGGSAGSGAVWSLRSNALRPDGWTSADAAGLPILPGLLRWNEVRDDRIDHAIRFTTDVTSRHHLWPARHDAGSHQQPSPTRRWAPGSG